jgi:5,10-methylene-tetrahydrofolate dehydrogenase/methenyl tetrahydrofolate cyclohydrolase
VVRRFLGGLAVLLLLVSRHLCAQHHGHACCHHSNGRYGHVDHAISCCAVLCCHQGSWLKPGAVVIDVGTNPVDDPSKKTGYRCETVSERQRHAFE